MRDLVNLLVDLGDERCGADAAASARAALDAAGYALHVADGSDDTLLAWIDQRFGGTWSSEAYAGSSVVAHRDGEIAGFCTYGARDMRFAWLRGVAREPGVGIFGPFGVAESERGGNLGRNLATLAFASLREAGFTRALIPAVGGDGLIAYYRRLAGARVVETFARDHWFARRVRTVVMASGNGSNFQAVLDRVAVQELPLDIVGLVTNRASAFALERARAANVPPVLCVWDRAQRSRAQYDAELLNAVSGYDPELVLLLGWMHVLDAAFIARFPDAINIHPAFLPHDQAREVVGMPDGTVIPAFRGAQAVRDAVAAGVAWTGATAHGLTLEADRGAVLARRPLRIAPSESVEAVLARLHPIEHEVVAAAIRRFIFEHAVFAE